MLNGKQFDAIEKMISGASQVDIAKSIGIDRTTLYRWTKDEEFMVELEAHRTDSRDRVIGGFSALLDRLIANIDELATDKTVAPSIRLQASQYGINMALMLKKNEAAKDQVKDQESKKETTKEFFTQLKAVGE